MIFAAKYLNSMVLFPIAYLFGIPYASRQTDGRTDRRTDRQTDEQADERTDRQNVIS